MEELLMYVRENEACSCPILMFPNNQPAIAIFTYIESDEIPITIYGYNQLIIAENDKIVSINKDLFESESELIVIDELPLVSIEEHEAMYNSYYEALGSLIDNFSSESQNKYLSELSKAFKRIIPDNCMELYRRICPDYLSLLKI